MKEFTFVVVDNQLDYCVDLFVKMKQIMRKPRTVEWYQNVLRYYQNTITHLDSNWPPAPHHCLIFFESLDGLSDYTKDNYHRALRSFFNWLKRTKFIVDNPLDYIDCPDTPRPLPKAPPFAYIRTLFDTIRQGGTDNWRYVRDMALFSIALDTGARIGEIEMFTMDQVDMTNQQIDLHLAAKTKTGRALELGDEAAADLAAWVVRRIELSQGENFPKSLHYLFVSDYQRQGFRRFTQRGMRTRLYYWQEKAQIPHFTFNAFRHAYAIYSLRNKADLLDIKEQMGHKSIKTTAIYTEVVDEERKKRHRRTSPRKNL